MSGQVKRGGWRAHKWRQILAEFEVKSLLRKDSKSGSMVSE